MMLSSENCKTTHPRLLRQATMTGAILLGLCSHAGADMLHVSESEAKQAAVAKASPVMPLIAKQAHIAGKVVLDLTVNEDGSVEKVDVVSGNPILGGAASKAGKNWTFSPFKGPDGKPSKASVRLSFDFIS